MPDALRGPILPLPAERPDGISPHPIPPERIGRGNLRRAWGRRARAAPRSAAKGRSPVVSSGKRHKPGGLGVGARLLSTLVVPWALLAGGCGFWDDFRAADCSFRTYF